MTFGYLAQPIDQSRRQQGVNRLIAAARLLASETGVDLFAPGRAYHLANRRSLLGNTASAIDTINATALDVAEILFAVIPSGVPTLGTPVEIERCLGRGLPVVIVTESRLWQTSVQMQSWAQSGALVATLEAIEGDPLRAAAACREMLRSAPPVPTEPLPGALPYVRTHEAASTPSKAYEDDAGLDLAACEPAVIPPGGRALIRTGLKFALPAGFWGLIVGRSSTWAKRGLDVKLGVIDAGWRGELFVSVHNPGTDEVKVEVGERLAQYILLPAWMGKLMQVASLPDHERGENGFGSSGR